MSQRAASAKKLEPIDGDLLERGDRLDRPRGRSAAMFPSTATGRFRDGPETAPFRAPSPPPSGEIPSLPRGAEFLGANLRPGRGVRFPLWPSWVTEHRPRARRDRDAHAGPSVPTGTDKAILCVAALGRSET